MMEIPGSGMQNIFERCGNGEEIALNSNCVDSMVDRLCYVNFRQWKLEDDIREPAIAPERALELIRAIQASNSERVSLIEQIDRYFVEREIEESLGGTEDKVEFHETLGHVLDALSILYIRRYHLKRLIAQGFDSHPKGGYFNADAVAAIDEQIKLSERCFSRYRALLREGRMTLPPFNRFKMYGAPNIPKGN
jgi:hypothetical protein